MNLKNVLTGFFFAMLLNLAVFATDFSGYIVNVKSDTLSNLNDMSMFSQGVLMSDISDKDVTGIIADEVDGVTEIFSDRLLLKAENEAVLNVLVTLGIVEAYEPDYIAELYGYDYSTNPSYSNQKWVYDVINADFARKAGIFGEGVRVGVVDSGVYNHSDFEGNIVEGYNFVDNNADTGDEYFHGTMAAGIIAARSNNTAIVGLAHKSKIVPLKVAKQKSFSISAAITAINKAVSEFDCDVINLSFGITDYSVNLKNAVDDAISKGAIVVAAAGNGGGSSNSSNNNYTYPAAYDEVISVANVSNVGGVMKIFNTSQVNDKIDIAAPGTSVVSLSNFGNGTITSTGTSFSAPLVSAVAALAKSINPNITQSQFASYLDRTADSSYLSETQGSNYWGKGMLNVEKLLKSVLSDTGKKIYVSPVDTDTNGRKSVYISNTQKSVITDFALVADEYSGSRLSAFKVIPQSSLNSFDSREIYVHTYGFSNKANVKVVADRIPGDINGDGEINVKDVTRLMQLRAGWTVDVVNSNLDVNGDGSITVNDATRLMQYLAGWVVAIK